MEEKENLIEKKIKEHIDDEKTVFVFPTGISSQLWADRATLTSGRSAVPMERFIAWDDFKTASIKSHVEGKTSIPSVMRKVFSSNLIEQNAFSPFLKYLIVPEYAKKSASFANWISSILPSLSSWKEKFDSSKNQPDDEDDDLLALYEKYKAFLDSHSLFDPAWEKPPFVSDGNKYIIFYPEVLMDFAEYKTLLSSSDDIEIVTIDNKEQVKIETPSVDFFSNSREELKYIALYMRALHEKQNIAWEDFAISVPDLETYSPYLTRELSIYEIPYALKMGQNLTTYGAGAFFTQIQNCYENSFSFDSIKQLVLNTELPWKEQKLNQELIQFGKDNNCICSYEYNGKKVDVWEESFSSLHDAQYYRLSEYYISLKKYISNIASCKSFAEINKAYFEFKDKFFSMENCADSSDKILSRCITELGSLVDLEKEFDDCKISSSYKFFTDVLAEKVYLSQSNSLGVQIFPYKLASTAPFACHFVIDASQSSASIVFKQLGFLSESKRTKLHLTEENTSESFIKLYSANSYNMPFFSCSEKTFSGYSLPHSFLKEVDLRTGEKDTADNIKEAAALCGEDFYSSEKDYLLEKTKSFPESITALQKESFSKWIFENGDASLKNFIDELKTDSSSENSTTSLQDNSIELYKAALDKKIKETVFDSKLNKIKISKSYLNKFYSCPRSFLFQYIIGVEQVDNEAVLIDSFAVGNLNHDIMHLYCSELKRQNLVLHMEEEKLTEQYEGILKSCTTKAIETIRNTSHLARELLSTEENAIFENIKLAAVEFSKWFEGYKILETEKAYNYEPEGKNFFYNGRIDCLLYSPEDEIVLVDFKSSKGGIPFSTFYFSEENEVPDFQMPIYLMLIENSSEKKIKVDTTAYFSIKDMAPFVVTGSLKNPSPRGKTLEGEDFASTIEKTKELSDLFAKRIEQKDFSVDNDKQDFLTCNECAYRSICRRVFTVSKKND